MAGRRWWHLRLTPTLVAVTGGTALAAFEDNPLPFWWDGIGSISDKHLTCSCGMTALAAFEIKLLPVLDGTGVGGI